MANESIVIDDDGWFDTAQVAYKWDKKQNEYKIFKIKVLIGGKMIEVTESFVKQRIQDLEKLILEQKTKNSFSDVSSVRSELSAYQSVFSFIQGQKEARKKS